MPLVKTMRRRGVTITVEAHGEVLFTPTGAYGAWTRRFSNRITSAARRAAPTNKRQRWSHSGKPLKTTITSTTKYKPGAMRVYAAVGSSSPHAVYVDQGTGTFAGKSPWEAKILPPWGIGSPSLYESTWSPPGSQGRRQPVMIQGQKGQFFFDKGLQQAFRSMRMRAYQVPVDPRITNAILSAPADLTNFLASSGYNPDFRASLEEWRTWRDSAFYSGRMLGNRQGPYLSPKRRAQARRSAARRQASRTAQRTSPASTAAARKSSAQAKVMKALRARGYDVRGLKINDDHTWTALVKGRGTRGVFAPREGRW